MELPEGSYRVRISSPGIVSETCSLNISRGDHVGYDTHLEDRSLWPPLEMTPGDFIDPVELPGRGNGLLRYRGPDASFRLLDGATGKPVWPQDLVLDKNNKPAGAVLEEWTTLLGSGTPWQTPPYAVIKEYAGRGNCSGVRLAAAAGTHCCVRGRRAKCSGCSAACRRSKA